MKTATASVSLLLLTTLALGASTGLKSNMYYIGVDFSGQSLSGEGDELLDTVFYSSDGGVQFAESRWESPGVFRYADSTNFRNAGFVEADFSSADWTGVRFLFEDSYSFGKEKMFGGADFTGAVFADAEFAWTGKNAETVARLAFAGADLSDADFDGAVFRLPASAAGDAGLFAGANLDGASFRNSLFENVGGAPAGSARTSARNADFTGARLEVDFGASGGGWDLAGAVFVGADLGGSVFGPGADISGARFEAADLAGTTGLEQASFGGSAPTFDSRTEFPADIEADSLEWTQTGEVQEERLVLPVDHGFESGEGFVTGDLHEQNGWRVDQGAARITEERAWAGSRSVKLDASEPFTQIRLPIEAGEPDVVFTRFRVKPFAIDPAAEEEFLDADSSLLAFFREGPESGQFHVYHADDGGWVPTGVSAPVDADGMARDWQGVVLRQDFDAAQPHWDLYIEGRLVAVDLGFGATVPDGPAAFIKMGHAGGPSYLDNLEIGFESPLFRDSSGDGIPDVFAGQLGLDPAQPNRRATTDADGTTVIEQYATSEDFDGDGWFNAAEHRLGADPYVPMDETVADGYREVATDGFLVFGLDPAWSEDRQFPNVFDADPNTFYDYAHEDRPAYVGFAAGEPVNPATIEFAPRNNWAHRMVGGVFQGSNESSRSGYETLYEITEIPQGGRQTVVVETDRQYRYFRYLAPAGSHGNIAEFEVVDEAGASFPAPVDIENTAPGDAPQGVRYWLYHGELDLLPDFSQLVPVATGKQDGIHLASADREDGFAFVFETDLQIEKADQYTFYLESDDGSSLSINGTEVIDNDGVHSLNEESATIDLDAGAHRLVVRYFERSGGQGLALSYASPEFDKQTVPAAKLTVPAESSLDLQAVGSDGSTDDGSTDDGSTDDGGTDDGGTDDGGNDDGSTDDGGTDSGSTDGDTTGSTDVPVGSNDVNIILDSDFAPDVDDAAALTMLHALADNGETDILGMGVSSLGEGARYGPAAMDVINTYYGRGDLPVGVNKGSGFAVGSRFTKELSEEFPQSVGTDLQTIPEATALYRRILAAQPDNSVTFVSIGFLSNLMQLLQSGPGEFSSLSGSELVARKVKRVVIMGGDYTSGDEHNFKKDPDAARFVVENWPTEMVFSGFSLGRWISTGAALADASPDNPLRRGYELFNGLSDRRSWDQTAVLFAVRGLGPYFNSVDDGHNVVFDDGTNQWRSGNDGKNHRYLTKAMANTDLEDVIEGLMIQEPSASGTDSGTGETTTSNSDTEESTGTDTTTTGESGTETVSEGHRESTVSGRLLFGLDPAWAEGREFEAALDGNPDTFYDYANEGAGAYAGFDYGETVVPGEIRFTPRSGFPGRMVGGRFQGSNESTTSGFVTLHEITNTPTDGQENVVALQTGESYRYYRYLAPADSFGNIATFAVVPAETSSGDGTGETTETTDDTTTDGTTDEETGVTIGDSTTAGNFELAESATTSAGIYDSRDRLVRTLWSNETRAAGTHEITWDGRDDRGNDIRGEDNYHASVIAHNVDYTWEGTIGNTSDEMTGERKYRSRHPLSDLAFAPDGRGIAAFGFAEGKHGLAAITEDNYQGRDPIARPDSKRVFSMVAADGDTFYAANIGNIFKEQETFIAAFSIDDPENFGKGFTNGTTVSPDQHQRRWDKTIYLGADPDPDGPVGEQRNRNLPGGLAVERDGPNLYVSLPLLDVVRAYDKETGDQIREFAVDNPTHLAVAPNQDLWVASGDRVLRFRKNGGSMELLTTLDGFAKPLALATDPRNGDLFVVDGGASSQIKKFSASGEPLRTFGQEGGYVANGPEVRPDKFHFMQLEENWEERSFITVSPDGRIWVLDTGNMRTLIFDENFNHLDTLMYLPASYNLAVDPNDPSRVFSVWLEFEVDYSKPIGEGWTLVRNWGGRLPADEYGGTASQGVSQAITYTVDGESRTFLRIQNLVNPPESMIETYEIVDNSKLRFTGQSSRLETALYRDGTRRTRTESEDGSRAIVLGQELTGFDASGNPVWSEETILAEAPYANNSPSNNQAFGSRSGQRWPSTGDGKVLFYSSGTQPEGYQGYHLGAVAEGGTGWEWEASPSGVWEVEDVEWDEETNSLANYDTRGDILTEDGSFHTGDVQRAGNRVMAIGENIIYGYHGEFFNTASGGTGQANQWLHWHDNGLFIGQFGKANYPWRTRAEATAEVAGNSFAPQLVEVNGELYLWHNDEGAHSGVHRWRLDGWDNVEEITVELP